jgi:hypothetical protein
MNPACLYVWTAASDALQYAVQTVLSFYVETSCQSSPDSGEPRNPSFAPFRISVAKKSSFVAQPPSSSFVRFYASSHVRYLAYII